MHCEEGCGGKAPCLNTCCNPGKAYDNATSCEPMSDDLTKFFLNSSTLFDDFRGLTKDNFAKAPSFMLDCPPGYSTDHRLKPDLREGRCSVLLEQHSF